MPSPFSTNTSSVPNERHKRFFDSEDNTIDKQKNTLKINMNRRSISMLIKILPHIINHYERFFDKDDEGDIEFMNDLTEFYQELIEIKTVFVSDTPAQSEEFDPLKKKDIIS